MFERRHLQSHTYFRLWSGVRLSLPFPRYTFKYRPVGQLLHLFEMLVESNSTELDVHVSATDTPGQLAIQAAAPY